MAPITKLALGALFALQASAHFILNYPSSIGFSDDDEPTAPCGGFTPDLTKDNVTDFHVGGDTVYLSSFHPTITFLYRATLDTTAMSGYQNLLASTVQVNGLNGNCNPLVPAPASFVGKKGILQVVADSPDGVLYQCAAVNFVSGSGSAKGSGGCTNSSGVTMSYMSDSILAGIGGSSGSSTGSNSSNATSSSSSTSSSAAATSKSAGGTITPTYGATGTIVWMLAIALGSALIRLL